MTELDEIRRDVTRGIKRAQYSTALRGYLGRPTATGKYSFEGLKPGTMPCRIVRADDDTVVGEIDVTNHSVVRDPRIRVLIDENPNGDMVVIGVDDDWANEQAGDDVAVFIACPPHTHAIGFGYEDPVEQRRLLPGLVHVYQGGLTVEVKPFWYEFEGTEKYYAGGTIDLTSYLPTTSDYWAWVLVGLDKSSNTLTAVKGTEYASRASLLVTLLPAIDLGEDVERLAAIELQNGQAAIDEEQYFTDIRKFMGGGGATISDVLTTIVVACGEVVTSGGEVVWSE